MSRPPPRRTLPARFTLAGLGLIALAGGAVALFGPPSQQPLALLATAAATGAAVANLVLTMLLVGRPIREIARTATAMADGDLTIRASVESDDEIGRLGDALNRLGRDLSRQIDELRGERDLLSGILDGMGEGVLVVDRDDRVVLANQALRGMASIGDGAIGQLVLEGIRNATLQEALTAARDQKESVVREIELGRLFPRRLLVRVSRLPQRNGEGEKAEGQRQERGLIAVFHDVTDLRRLETIRTDFVANVSHELRTPVTAISTAAETLLGGALADPKDAAEFVDVIDRHAQRLRHLVDDLLDLSKLESKGFRLALADVDLQGMVSHTVKLAQDPAGRRRVDIRMGSMAGIKVRADRRALEQVVMNLLDNAIKYAGEGAHVTLAAAARGGGEVELSVADDGVGISPAHLGRLFERFYRVDTGRSRELGGTGLGLSIVKHLVELMGGTIRVESSPGKGATFTIRLKDAAAQAA
jgi:two-component system, OmpR family, phosphate regulon sensor histidine kinase PhoR